MIGSGKAPSRMGLTLITVLAGAGLVPGASPAYATSSAGNAVVSWNANARCCAVLRHRPRQLHSLQLHAAGGGCTDATPVLRRYTSLSQAARENAVSRIFIGFHFRTAVEEGTEHGDRIGNRAVERFMRPAG